jgi:hypothetical protein
VSEESEVVALCNKCIPVYAMVTRVKKVTNYLPVSSQLGMNIANIVVLITVKTVVVIVAALVGTEFFIRPSEKFSSAVKTYSFHSVMF